jgi:IS5 family transposase
MNKKQKAPSKGAPKTKGKAQYRVRNWAEYNASLVQRGSVTFWVSDDVLEGWKAKPPVKRKRGAQQEYTDEAIECMLVLQAVFHLTLRQTEGFVQSVFEMMGVALDVPDYTTVCKRAKGLPVELPTTSSGPIHAVLDSSGLKLYGEGEWKARQHGHSKRRTWRKLHLSVDSATGELEAVVLTEASVDDAEAAKELLNQTQSPIDKLSADGAYDKRKVYDACLNRDVEQIAIPPRRDARIWQHGNCKKPPHPRDENLRRIRQVGRKRWKQEAGYHQRSLAENAMFRFKTIFGDHLASRQLPQQITEARIKCLALNRMTQLGMPDSYRVD